MNRPPMAIRTRNQFSQFWWIINQSKYSATKYMYTAQKWEFSINDFFSKCDQMRSFLRIWSHLLKKSLMEYFIFCAVVVVITRCWVQYGKYFPSFSYFATYFMSLWASEIIAKYEKREKYLFVQITYSKSYLTY